MTQLSAVQKNLMALTAACLVSGGCDRPTSAELARELGLVPESPTTTPERIKQVTLPDLFQNPNRFRDDFISVTFNVQPGLVGQDSKTTVYYYDLTTLHPEGGVYFQGTLKVAAISTLPLPADTRGVQGEFRIDPSSGIPFILVKNALIPTLDSVPVNK